MKFGLFIIVLMALLGCQSGTKTRPGVIEVASFSGQQVTGVAVTNDGRMFVNFPRWRKGVENSVLEVRQDGSHLPYPDGDWNRWEIGDNIADSLFIAVQSVVAYQNYLYVLDTRNPLFQGVVDTPRLFVFDLIANKLKKVLLLSDSAFKPNSYINDLRVDEKNEKIYLTDSGEGGLVVLDMITGESKRILDNHKSTMAETDHLTINGEKWENTVHSDGIALDVRNEKLYYHSLTGYSLYAIPTEKLNISSGKSLEAAVELVAKTSAPDGMVFDDRGNLYFADLENNKINYLDSLGQQHILFAGDEIKWADSFAIYGGYLFFTNSRIHEAGGDISAMKFSLNKIKIAD